MNRNAGAFTANAADAQGPAFQLTNALYNAEANASCVQFFHVRTRFYRETRPSFDNAKPVCITANLEANMFITLQYPQRLETALTFCSW